MTPEFVIGFARQSIELTLMIALPMLGIGLIVGVLVSIIQAATQIQEMTLTFVPKIIIVFASLIFLLPFMIRHITEFTYRVMDVVVALP